MVHHRPARPSARRITFLLSVAISCLAFRLIRDHPMIGAVAAAAADVADEVLPHVTDAHEDDEEEEYEIKVQEALERYAESSNKLLGRALREGGGMDAADVGGMEVGADGSVVSTGEGEEQQQLWHTEFALQALERELRILDFTRSKFDDDFDSGDSDDYSGDSEDYDYYDSGDSGDDDYYSGDDYDDEDEFRFNNGDYSDDDHDSNDSDDIEDPAVMALLENIEDEADRRDAYNTIMGEANLRDDLDPDLWFQYSYWELHAYYSCARVFAGPRTVYDPEKWNDLREYYHAFIIEDKEEREWKKPRSYQFSAESFDPPMEPFQAGDKGRGLQAGRDISKGELVFKATNNTVIFTHGHTWRKFLFAIHERNGEPFDDETTCDVLVWSWVQSLVEGGPLVIVADLDNGSLLNEGRDEPNWDMPNVRCGKEGDTKCMMEYYATTDIKKGAELLCDYREFALLNAWGDMGL